MTKQEYLDALPKVNGEPNIPLVICDRKYKLGGDKKDLHRCEMADDGWKCPACKQIYDYLA